MNQEESILKLLEEGDSAAIRLGHQLLSAADQPQDPMLALWKQVFDLVEMEGEMELFLLHMPALKAEGPNGVIEWVDHWHSSSQMDKLSLRGMVERVRMSLPIGRLKTMCDGVLKSVADREARSMATRQALGQEYNYGPVGIEFKKEWDKAIKAMAQDFLTDTP